MGCTVLYEDLSGVFGEWILNKELKEWEFVKKISCCLTEEDMKYLLKELKKIKRKVK